MSFDTPSRSAASSSSVDSGKKRSGLSNPTPKNPSSRKKPFKQPPFPDFGSYMAEKNRKLRAQFSASASTSTFSHGGDSGGDSTGKGIFYGISIFVDGFTVPSNQELKAYMLKHGGRFENYFSRQRVTHIVCSNLPDSKMKNLRAFSRGLPVVKPAWILESVVANKLLNWVPYQLIELVNESGNQRKLSSFFAVKSNSISTDFDVVKDPCAKLDANCPGSIQRLLPPGEENFLSCKWPDGDESVCFEQERDCEERTAEAKFTDLEDMQSFVEESDSNPNRLPDSGGAICMDNSCPATSSLSASNLHHSTHGDPNFVENYFKNSRLHFIGTWRNRYRKRFCNKLSGVKHSIIGANSISTAQKSSVVHIDMDSFFVSVVIRNYPELVNKPVAVCHSDSPKGTAEVSSANYPAREYGVRAGMFVRDAKARCPHLVIIPYDFEAYEEVADQFYSILHKHCNKVQAVSCDEAYLDVTESASNDPEHLALMIRKEIAETTRCTASAGIAENILLARLATRSAKPNGQCFISPEKVDSYLEELPIKALPGVGHSLGEKLKSGQIHTCGQLRLIPKETLQKDFGTKTGDMLWNYCRGIDNRAVDVIQETKSVGAEVNWGVRFNDIVECEKFLLNLCREVSFRLQECGVEGRTITLKVKKRRKGAEEPTKFMGCGDCENMSRSITLPLATDDMALLERIAKKIFASFHTDVKDVRGVGLQISRLETVDSSKRGREKIALESLLVSYGKTREQGKETTNAFKLGDYGETFFREEKPNCRTEPDDARFQPCCNDEGQSSGPSCVKLSSARAHDNSTSMLPPLCQLDIEVIKNLPPEIFSEMNDMYNGSLYNIMKKYEEDAKNMKYKESPLEENEITLPSGYQKMGSNVDGNMTSRQTACPESYSDNKKKGKQPLCSPDLPLSSLPLQSKRTQSTFDDDSVGCHEKHPVTERTQNIYTSKINLWLGQPPKWVEMFTVSSCLLLNAVADLYVKSGRNCSLSSILQSLLSSCSPIFDWTSEGWDEALSSLCELIIQYIALKIETDIEELYICFRLLKRFSSTSEFMSEVYNSVLPPLQVSVNDQYGGPLQLSLSD